ncbi:MAG TPA: YciI family protein [Kofleriaceae bacterium]
MRIMMTLLGNAPTAPIDAYLAKANAHVITSLRLAEDGAIASLIGDTITIERTTSALRAVWILDVPSRTFAIELARNAPGDDGTLEIRESYTPADFGAPEEPTPPPPPTKPGNLRYVAFIRTDHVAENGAPPDPKTLARMDEYCAPLAASGTMLGGEGLKSSARGARIRRSAAQRFVLDGPFTESKELVGGYMLVQAHSLDDVLELIRPWLVIHKEGARVDQSHIEVRRLLDDDRSLVVGA